MTERPRPSSKKAGQRPSAQPDLSALVPAGGLHIQAMARYENGPTVLALGNKDRPDRGGPSSTPTVIVVVSGGDFEVGQQVTELPPEAQLASTFFKNTKTNTSR
jgi:hypothetical protein